MPGGSPYAGKSPLTVRRRLRQHHLARGSPMQKITRDDRGSNRRRPPQRLDGVTAGERDRPFTDDPQLLAQEQIAADSRPDQLELFAPGPGGRFAPLLGGVPPLEATSSLELARAWYRRELEQARRPANTIESYCYDLVKLEERTGPK